MLHGKKGLLLLIGAVIAVSGGGGYWYHQQQAAPATVKQTSQKDRVIKKRVTLVALGDSLTHGQGDNKNEQGYVGRIKKKLQNHYHNRVTTYNYGVTGDRSDQMLKRLNEQPEMRANLKKADVIVMTVGGNDLMQKLESNLLSNSSDKIESNLDQAGTTYQAKLNELLSAVRKQNASAPIFMYSIYDPVYTYFPDVSIINDSIDKWNQITKQTVAQYGPSYFVDINQLMSYGQYKTAKQRQKLSRQAKKANSDQVTQKQVIAIMNNDTHNLNEYISTDDNFHPNAKGYDQMTNALYKVMLKHDDWEYQQK